MDLLAELDSFLSTASTKAKLEAKKEGLLKKANNKYSSTGERRAAKAKLTSILEELHQIQWKPVASVALFAEQVCTCGSTHQIFLQFMLEEETISRPRVNRLSRMAQRIPSLPAKTLKQTTSTDICADCVENHGFGHPDSAEIKLRGPALTPGDSKK